MNQTRREFLRSSLTMALVSCAAPGRMLALYLPRLREESGGVTAIYSIRVSDHPSLAKPGGSIRLEQIDELQMNPDHCENTGWSGRNFPIALTRVAESGEDAFRAVSTFCTHGFGFSVRLDTAAGTFVCPHRSAEFSTDGTLVHGPAQSDLRTFRATFDGVDTITIEHLLTQCQVAEMSASKVPGALFLDENIPNPARERTVIRYGLPAATQVHLSIVSLDGREERTLINEQQEAGIHLCELNVATMASGVYIYRLTTATSTLVRKLTVAR